MKESLWEYCMRTGKTHLLCEWSCKKNGIKLSPRNITSANGRKVWWECGIHGWLPYTQEPSRMRAVRFVQIIRSGRASMTWHLSRLNWQGSGTNRSTAREHRKTHLREAMRRSGGVVRSGISGVHRSRFERSKGTAVLFAPGRSGREYRLRR